MRNPDVSHLRMQPAVNQAPVHNSSRADPGANGNVDEIVDSLRRTPAAFGHRRRIHVRVELHWPSKCSANGTGKVTVTPGRLGRRGNESKGGRPGVRIDRSEGRNPNSIEGRILPKEIDGARDGFSGLRGWEFERFDVLRPSPHGTNKLGTSGFDPSEKRHGSSLPGKLRLQSLTGYNKSIHMKCSEITCVFAIFGLAAVVLAQPPAPPKTAPATPPTPAAAPESTVAADAVVLTIGEHKITRAQFEQLLAVVAKNGHPATTAAAKRQVAEQYGDLETMAGEARKRKIDQTLEAKLTLDNVLANILAKKLTDEAQFTDQDLHAYYDAHKTEYEEAQGSHILIRFKGSAVPLKPNEKDLTDAEALAKTQELRSKIAAGGDFATIAKAESDDAGSAAKGGDLGSFRHGQMVAPFDKAAFSIPVGQLSEPVKTQFGYHLIKISSRTAKSFDEAKPEIEKQLKPTMAKEALEKIKTQSPVTLNDEYFGK